LRAIQELRNDFTRTTRHKGEDYFRRKAVKIMDHDATRIRARVQGSELYNVDIQWGGEEFTYDCSCPHFEQHGELCKHLWATLLTAEAQGILPQPDRNGDEDQDEDEDADFIAEPKRMKFGDREVELIRFREKPARPDEKPKRHAVWRRRLTELRSSWQWRKRPDPAPWPADKQIVYVIDGEVSSDGDGLAIELRSRSAGKPGDVKRLRLRADQISILPDPLDRELISMLVGLAARGDEYGGYEVNEIDDEIRIPGANNNSLVQMMCRTGRCLLRTEGEGAKGEPLQWDEGEPWRLHLAIVPDAAGETYHLDGSLRRGEEKMAISDATLIIAGGPIFIGGKAAAFEDDGTYAFVHLLRTEQQFAAPIEQGDDLLEELLQFPGLPKLELPEAMQVAESRPVPRPKLSFGAPPATPQGASGTALSCSLSFDYDQQNIPHGREGRAILARTQRQLIYRDTAAEQQAVARLRELGFRQHSDYQENGHQFQLLPRKLPAAVRALTLQKWQVEVSGKIYRQPGKIKMEVASSGIDWFELDGSADFDGVTVELPALLRAISKGETTIVLDDGTIGILPEQWLKRYGLLAAVAEVKDDSIQFTKRQVGLLDALLAEIPETNIDETYAKARNELRRFDGIKAVAPPETFIGSLRPYQSEGLGWLNFLPTFGLNGCLADDMGLGKTVQVLALLEQRRLLRKTEPKIGPSLVVVPRSLVFNWREEAAKFTPALRVLEHASADRLKTTEHFGDYDLILTTYGTLRNDIVQWRDVHFDYVILDEAQAIKNAASESAKAARLLSANHRLALSGTPVQNHLGELWSLLEFLNPGMLGASRAFASLTMTPDRAASAETRQFLAGALRPFILRRTKEQVASDLPEKFEQTLFCELDKPQRELYDELKAHYRQSLLGQIDREGLGKSKLQILEALLRLRQAACHPGLLNKSRIDDKSAKLETLLPRLAEVAEEGHKTLVFSQFTSLLAIVRKRLDERGVVYEYLDGKTRDRQQHVDRFQTDPECKLFLISLKAGGLGLNLTAAQYVFLLDPWWNPAVEAQAIDRAHRIGQTEQVFAYRLIAKDTVEEKVLKLQQTKRELADAIINADNGLISKLGREDLELLLS